VLAPERILRRCSLSLGSSATKHTPNNLDDIDEDDVPMAAIRTMAIGDVRPQEQQEQDQPSSSTMVHPLLRMMNRFIKKRRMIKGDHKKNKLRKKHHWPLQLKSERRFKEITPSNRFWVT
jgi:hypothetical protein